MITVLSEFQILDTKRDQFLHLLDEVKEDLEKLGAKDIVFFEGTDQPGLFVEEFTVQDMEHYQQIKNVRYQENSLVWNKFHTCINGGKKKFNIWAFKKVD